MKIYVSGDMTKAQALAIADWHMFQASNRLNSQAQCERHDMIAFIIFKRVHAGLHG
jgi:hypothetical protein